VATTLEQPAPGARSAEEERLIALQKRDTRRKWFWRIAGYVVVLGVWELASGTILNENLLPGPIRIIQTFPDLIESGRFLSSFAATLTRIGIGFGLSFILGILLGIFTQSRWVVGLFKEAVHISLFK
jgi:NitT/TauT family transport system permease protein